MSGTLRAGRDRMIGPAGERASADSTVQFECNWRLLFDVQCQR